MARRMVVPLTVTLMVLVVVLPTFAQDDAATVAPPNAPAPPEVADDDCLIVDNMEEDLRWHDVMDKNMTDLVRDEEIVREGDASGLWEPETAAKYIFNRFIPHDWTGYDTLAMAIHSEEATGATMQIILASNNPETEQTDFYRHILKIDWEGWREVRLGRRSFHPAYEPMGRGQIDNIRLCLEGGFAEYVPGTVLRIDDIRLLPEREGADTKIIFDSDVDWGCMGVSGGTLDYVMDPTGSGERVAKWDDTVTQTFIWHAGAPKDWSGFSYLNMWVYCDHPDAGQFLVMCESENPETEGQDSYQVKLPLEWEGWKLFTLPFSEMQVVRKPLGGDHIDALKFYTAPYCEQGDGTSLLFGDMWLSVEAEEAEGE